MHEHMECEHELKYCKICRVAYCTKCNRQWYEYSFTIYQPYYPYYPYWSNTGSAQVNDNGDYTITYGTHQHTGD